MKPPRPERDALLPFVEARLRELVFLADHMRHEPAMPTAAIDVGHDGIVGAKDLAGRTVTPEQLSQGPNPWMFWKTRVRYTKDQYLVLAETWFVAADADNDGTLDAKELQTAPGQQLLKLLQ